MPFPISAQLSVELTNILPVGHAVSAIATSVYQLARDLRKSGSDLLVEEDLAGIFSRFKIDSRLQLHFKDVVKLGSASALYSESRILLDSGPGPTTRRALKEQYYMATVIQLSFLSWFHERTTLATSLVECMNSRFNSNVPGSNSDANYDGILQTLTAICAETSRFPWALYAGLVEARLPKTSLEMASRLGVLSWKCLSPTLLLAAMDYLLVVQSLPDDRIVQTQTPDGLVPMVIWAHFILGLTVTVQGSPDGNITFGKATRPNAIISWAPKTYEPQPNSIFLLDGSMEVILETQPDLSGVKIDAQERIPLQGYGTTHLRREFNCNTLIPDDDIIYSDSAQLATTIAILMNLVLYRPLITSMPVSMLHSQSFDSTERWRIFAAATVLFSGINIDKSTINNWVEKYQGLSIQDMNKKLPIALRRFFGKDDEENTFAMRSVIIPSAILILIFAHASNVEACATMPLVYGHDSLEFRDRFIRDLHKWDGKSTISIAEDDWFNQICKLLIGVRFLDQPPSNQNRVFLASEYGWSVYFMNVGDIDPSQVELNLICIREGVPFSAKTNERKYRILDAPPIIDVTPPNQIIDKTGSYVPRCTSRVVKNVEHYSSRTQEFWHICRSDVDESVCVTDPILAKFSLHSCYRQLHRTLWGVLQTDPCEHGDQKIETYELGVDAVTVKGFNWSDKGGSDDFNERICILLVSGDRRARWLALSALTDFSYMPAPKRQVLLRGEYCCENCAVEMAAELPNKWLVIL